MSNNREVRTPVDSVHILMGLKRGKFAPNSQKQCIRTIIKDYETDLVSLEAKLLRLGGEWRIHKTVNARDVKKAAKLLMHTLIDRPEVAGYLDSEWRTCLLQRACIYGEKKFMLDVDTQEESLIGKLEEVLLEVKAEVLDRIKSPKGWHYITKPFDTRKVILLGAEVDTKGKITKPGYVTLQRDGYVYIKTVGFPMVQHDCGHEGFTSVIPTDNGKSECTMCANLRIHGRAI